MVDMSEVSIGYAYWVWVWAGDRTTATGRISTSDLSCVTVIRKGKKKVRVRLDDGSEGWIYPDRLVSIK